MSHPRKKKSQIIFMHHPEQKFNLMALILESAFMQQFKESVLLLFFLDFFFNVDFFLSLY